MSEAEPRVCYIPAQRILITHEGDDLRVIENVLGHDADCTVELVPRSTAVDDAAWSPLTVQMPPGVSLWFVSDGDSNGVQQAVRLDRRPDAQYPCIGRDAAILRGLLDHVRALLDEPAQLLRRTTRLSGPADEAR